MKAGLYTDIDHARYHADNLRDVPTLSHSIACKLVGRSPLHAHFAHPRLGNGERESPTAAMDGGSLIDLLLLGGGPEVVPIDAVDWRTTAAKDARDAARAAGKLPVLIAKYGEAAKLADQVKAELAKMGLKLSGQSQVTALWQEGETWCRARLDHWIERSATILDVKFLESAHPDAFTRYAINFGADIQASAYTSAVETIRPDLAGRVQFIFVVIESTPPHPISLFEMRGTMRELGGRKWRKAIDVWTRCLAANNWPGYSSDIVGVEAPEWALSRDMEQQAREIEGGSGGISF